MRTIIVEDEILTRELLRTICTRELGHAIVGEAADGPTAIELIAREQPGLVLLDLQLPGGMNGFEILETIQRLPGAPRVLVFSGRCDEYTVFRLERARVSGFMDKGSESLSVVRDAIEAVSHGEHYFSENFERVKATRRDDPRSFDKLLTKRQVQILLLIGDLMTDEEIAAKLRMSAKAVDTQVKSILGRIGCETRQELERYAREHGLADPFVSRPRR